MSNTIDHTVHAVSGRAAASAATFLRHAHQLARWYGHALARIRRRASSAHTWSPTPSR